MRFNDAVDNRIKPVVSNTWSGIETLRRCLRKTGKSPKTWMLNRVRLNTELVDGKREAKTVEAISAALVESDEGNGGARAGDGTLADGLDMASLDMPGSVRGRARTGGCGSKDDPLFGARLR